MFPLKNKHMLETITCPSSDKDSKQESMNTHNRYLHEGNKLKMPDKLWEQMKR
jgi:hypothetical protein